jgi:hypothetical protein
MSIKKYGAMDVPMLLHNLEIGQAKLASTHNTMPRAQTLFWSLWGQMMSALHQVRLDLL